MSKIITLLTLSFLIYSCSKHPEKMDSYQLLKGCHKELMNNEPNGEICTYWFTHDK